MSNITKWIADKRAELDLEADDHVCPFVIAQWLDELQAIIDSNKIETDGCPRGKHG